MKIKLWGVYVMSWDENHEYTSAHIFGTKKEAQKLMNDEFANATNPKWYDVLSMIDGDSHKRAVYCDDRGGVEYTLREEYVDVDEFAVVKPVTRKHWVLMHDDTASLYIVPVDSVVLQVFESEEDAIAKMNQEVLLVIGDLQRNNAFYDVKHGKTFAEVRSEDREQSWMIRELEVPV